jgi:hypothetical protein
MLQGFIEKDLRILKLSLTFKAKTLISLELLLEGTDLIFEIGNILSMLIS